MQHQPAMVLSENRKSKRWACCKYENIDARNSTRLSLLLTLDSKLNIPNGFADHTRCEALRARRTAVLYCGRGD